MPRLALTDEEIDVATRAAAPIAPAQREAFFAALAEALAPHPAIGPGLVHRIAAEIQGRFIAELIAEAAVDQSSPARNPAVCRARAAGLAATRGGKWEAATVANVLRRLG